MLPVKLIPHEHELISSWLIRLSFANGISLRRLSQLIFDNSSLIQKDIDKYLNKDTINKISQVTEIPKNHIYTLTLQYSISNIYYQQPITQSKWSWVIPTGGKYILKTHGLQFCPECLYDKGIMFSHFSRLSWNICCEKHKRLLHSKCPKCNHPYAPQLIEPNYELSLCIYCGFDLSTIEDSLCISSEAIELQQFLNQCFLTNKIPSSKYQILDKSIKEVFYTVRVIVQFLYRIRNKTSLLQNLKDELHIKFLTYNFQTEPKPLDTLSSQKRMVLMHNVSLLLKQPILNVEKCLLSQRITYRQLFGSNNSIPHSQTIKFLCKSLKIRTANQPTKQPTIIKPKSKEEVDTLMYHIEEYL
ncbi:TniQ family protein [Candidatus Marinarcus aquaticus]|uniref:TniQ domain-containing protein n=1 Tax=Candidatus Marinarcus aquaticus TaxID=2044504 RepID=A0A4Q0XN09_9BACT|nr:TniQ family protein [Candidatus Marinarcus aquaticus]RXJ54560.1 hypothetical protein CRV04_11020 [Candidatus Marinarcus aquaticus]